jgi:hypothetical protein
MTVSGLLLILEFFITVSTRATDSISGNQLGCQYGFFDWSANLQGRDDSIHQSDLEDVSHMASPSSLYWLFLINVTFPLPVFMKRTVTPTPFSLLDISDMSDVVKAASVGWHALYGSGSPAKWPDTFGDRLDVLKFDFAVDKSTGLPVTTTEPNSSLSVCDMMQPLSVCSDGGGRFCDGLMMGIGPGKNCDSHCDENGLVCSAAVLSDKCVAMPDIGRDNCSTVATMIICRCSRDEQ